MTEIFRPIELLKREDNYFFPNELLRRRDISINDKFVCVIINKHAEADTISKISKLCLLSESTVRRSMKKLKLKGLIK